MADVYTLTIKPIADLGDIKANVGTIQNYFDKLKMPKFSNQIKDEAAKIEKEYDKINKKQIEGIKTVADKNQIEKSQNIILHSWNEILEVIKQVDGTEINIDFDKFTSKVKEAQNEVERLGKQLNEELKQGNVSGIKNLLTGSGGILQTESGSIDVGALSKTTSSKKLRAYASEMEAALNTNQITKFLQIYKEAKQYVDSNPMFGEKTKQSMDAMGQAVDKLKESVSSQTISNYEAAQTKVFEEQKIAVDGVTKSIHETANATNEYNQQAKSVADNNLKIANSSIELSRTAQTIERQVESYFGLNAIFRTVANMAREAMETVKTLDKAMTETAVVTNFSVGDMWNKLPIYTEQANKLGSTIEDVYRATTLYYQQGLNTTQSMGLAVETLKMARIAGMDAKDATDAMTAALRGFNLELNQVSAQRINDVYSELAAITASDTQEISTAMEKVASLAHNAGMELETTAALLAQMIETTREAPENLGTALKTVVARFQEMKQDPTKLIDSEGVMLDANKVDKALKSIGVNLMNANGEFRKLDDVFLEIASKWDTLSMGQQRYIATMAAGSRQQSRFIAMMSNYSRTMELVDAAYDSSGASQRQFEKTLESMDSKLNQLKNAWDQFIMGLMNNEFLKWAVDAGTTILTLVNNIIDAISNKTGALKGATKMLLTLFTTVGGLTGAKGLLKGGIGLGVQWFSGKEARQEFEKKYFGKKEGEAEFQILPRINKQALAAEKAKLKAETSKPLLQHIEPVVDRSEEIREKGRGYIESYRLMGDNYSADELEKDIEYQAQQSAEAANNYNKTAASVNNLGVKFQGAGVALQAFGNLLQNTPLAPFGKAISLVGTAVISLGGMFGTVSTLMIEQSLSLGAALWTALAPMLAIAAAIAAVVAVGYVLYRAFTKDKREMEALAEAAKISSDAFDNLKTATEELKNSIEEIRNADSLFDGLVVGTTEWNLALVEANQQVLDLIKKYPMLQEYMTTDANGRMHISEAGFEAVQKEQNKLLGQAQALDIYNNALHNAALTEQEKDKLLKDEGIHKTKAGTRRVHGKEQTISQSQADEINYNALSEEGKREWDGIQARIKAESDAANKQAIRAALSSSGELNDTVLNLFSQNFDEAQKAFSASGVDTNTMKQAYADFIGGVFDSATGKITDLSGEEVDIDNDTLKKMYPQIMALLQFQEQAPQVEGAVKSLGKSFDSVFGNTKGSGFINDLLNNNFEIDVSALDKFMEMSDDELKKTLENLTDEQIHAIMQSDSATIDDLIGLLHDNGDRLKQVQVDTYKNAAIWWAKSVKRMNADVAKANADTLSKFMTSKLTIGGANAVNNFMSQISQGFDAATVSTMGQNLFDALLGQPEEAQAKIADLVNQIDWTSAIERGRFYETYAEGTKAFDDLTDGQKKFIKGQKQVDKSLDLTGKQFEELVQSSDFLEILTDKWKDFADESGKIDASGVQEMAKECGTLDKVLGLTEFSAENLAMALNYFQETGSFDGINAATLAAMQHFDALGNLVGQVKKDLDEFDEGQDYSEGIEAYRERMGTIKENYENGYYSNETALNAIKNLFGEEFYYKKVKEFGSNKELEKYLINNAAPLLTDNLQDTALMAIDNIAHGLDVFGEKMTDDIDERLKVFYGDNGLEFDIGDMTYDEVAAEMANRLNVSEELARGILEGLVGQDWGIVGDNLAEDLMKNGRSKGLDEFQRVLTTQTTGFNTEGGYAAISQSMFDALLKTGGYLEEFGDKTTASNALMADLNESFASLGVTVQTFDDITDNLNSYLAAKYGVEETDTAGIKQAGAQLFDANLTKGVGDFDQAIKQLQADGYNYQKAVELAYNQAKELDLETLLVDGKEMNISDILNVTEFNDAIEDFNEMGHWEDIGNTLADAIVQALYEAGIGNGRQKEEESTTSTTTTTVSNDSSASIERKVELKVDKSQAERSLELVENRIDELNEEIAQRKTLGLDTSELEEELDAAELQAEQYKSTIQDINSELDRINNRTINIHYAATGNIKPGGLVQETQFKGKNNHISTSGFYAGSSARGRYGTVGPKNRGGLTLTGEKGFEIAWLPSENRSMILGAHGPQMLSLPSDAVVYSHEQSKEIIKQKSIPAGSHAGHYDPPGGSSGGSGSGSGSGSSSSSSSKDKEKDPKHSNWYKEEVRRFNLNQSINQLTEKIEKITKSIGDTLAKLGVKYSDISKDVEKQTQLLHQTIAQQQQLRDSYKAELEWLANGNRQLWVSLTNASNESEEISVGTSQFISGNADTGYSVSYDAIVKYLQANGYGGDNLIANAESLFNLLNQQISNLQSGYNSANKAIEEAQQKLKDLVNQIKDTFYAWENELTRVYDLTKQLEINDSRNSRFTSEIGLLLSSVSTRFEDMTTILDRLNQAQSSSIQLTEQRLDLLYQMIEARKAEIAALMDAGATERAYYEQIKAENEQALKNNEALTAEMLAREAAAYDAYARAAWGQLYLTSTQNADGSYTFDLNETQLEEDRKAGKISEDTYNAIKDGFDNLVEEQIDFSEAITEAADYLKELGEQLDDYYKTMADLENDLIDAFIDAAQLEVSKLESLNSSLTNAVKGVIEQVKKSIDARRKAEDNAKTEADIARKQERLAALRANTAGGNQVEIAQLEKEIGDAQRSYGRTLEDQMLAQMQTQADEASKQRQQQIDLAKQQIEYNKQAGVYAAMADELLDDIKANATQIALLLDETKELGRGKWQQLIDENEIEKQVIEAGNASAAIPYLEEAIDQQKNLYEALLKLDQDMMEIVGTTAGQGQNNPNTPGIYNPTNGGIPTTGGTSSGGSGGSSGGSSGGGGGTANTNPNAHGKLASVPAAHQNTFSSAQKKALQQGLNDLKKDKLIGNFGADLVIDGIIGPKTTAAIVQLQKAVGTTQDGIWGPNTGNATHKKFPKYARGGLNKKTGPAWLDGTPTKPELVLNAQDTKNFIALKDILSGVMRTISHTDTSNIYNSPTNFEINVNVDKISSDYDVDKLTERIKRNIVKDATYRNVTQVRNFR